MKEDGGRMTEDREKQRTPVIGYGLSVVGLKS